MTLAEKIKILRKNRGWTQAVLSENNIYQKMLYRKWEAGVNTPPLESIKQVADVFMVPAAALIDDEIVFPMYIVNDKESPKELYRWNDLTDHTVWDADLNKGAVLHRFVNRGGCPYSAIFMGTEELMSCDRVYEQ